MKKYLLVLCIIVFSMGLMGIANATLIGDTVTSQVYYPNISTPRLTTTTTVVAAGLSDLMYPYFNTFSVNVEANQIFIDFIGGPATWVGSPFCGLVVDSLDDSSGNLLQDVVISTNFSGWDSSFVTFDSDTIFFNWNGLSFNENTYMTATLDFSAPVPEPATVLLLGTGLLGLAGASRKKILKK